MIDPLLILDDVLLKHRDATKWNDARLSRIKLISNTKVGNVGQDFIEELCKQLGLTVEFPVSKTGKRATQNPWDIKIRDKTFELKTATEDITGSFQFNHIRYHRKYDAVLCLGISLDQVFFGIWSKEEVSTGRAGNLVTMEKGTTASYKLTKKKVDLLAITEFDSRIQQFFT